MSADRLSFLDRCLTLWIFLALSVDILLGRYSPGFNSSFNAWPAASP